MTEEQTPNEAVNTETWRAGYNDVQRSLIRTNETEARIRLKRMGVDTLPRDAHILDFGCGNGNLLRVLQQQGFTNLVGLEPDADLTKVCPTGADVVVGGGPNLPFEDNSFDAIISMAVLHHLIGDKALHLQVAEFFRILRPGGALFYAEPANTLTRRLLTPLLMSPLGGITRFSRQKQIMVREEWDVIGEWLELEPHFVREVVIPAGFRVMRLRRLPLKSFLHAIKPES